MSARTVLHVGTMKTGTSHLQSRLYGNQDALLRHGVLVPGTTWKDQVNGVSQLRAEQGVPQDGPWAALAEEMAAHEGTAVISMEFLATLRPQLIEALCSSLPGVEAVITVRDLNRNLAAMWQETIQTGRSWSWEEYLSAAKTHGPGRRRDAGAEVPPAARSFWGHQNVVRIARNWSRVVPVTLVTVPPPDTPRDLLWRRFCQVLDVPEEPEGGWAPATRHNQSLGLASLQLLRRLNAHLDSIGMEYPAAKSMRKHHVAKLVLAARRPEEPSLGLPVDDWMRRRSALVLRRLQALDLALIGDWEELTPVAVAGVSPDEVSASLMLDAAVAALGGAVTWDVARERRLEELTQQLEGATGGAGSGPVVDGDPEPEPDDGDDGVDSDDGDEAGDDDDGGRRGPGLGLAR